MSTETEAGRVVLNLYKFVEVNDEIILKVYPVIKTTNKGWWINEGASKRYVSKSLPNPWAFPTSKKAFEAYVEHFSKRIRTLTSELEIAKARHSDFFEEHRRIYYGEESKRAEG
jgi:hypothetical protein